MKEETRFGCMDKDIAITDDYGEMIEVVTTSGNQSDYISTTGAMPDDFRFITRTGRTYCFDGTHET